MATFKSLPFIADSGSIETAQLIVQYNALLDVLGTMITSLKTVGNIGNVNTVATTAETAIQGVYKLTPQPNIPAMPGFTAR